MTIPKNINVTPPNLWRWQHETTGYIIGGAYSIGRLEAMVKDHCRANHLPDVENLHQKIIAYMCVAEPDYCYNNEPPTLKERLASFASAAVQWIKNGHNLVPHNVFEDRLRICNSCHYWRGESSFGLGSCGKCGCTGLKLFLPEQSCPDTPKHWLAYTGK